MGQIETVLNYSKRIETLLGKLGAEGKGIHSKVSSIEEHLNTDFVKDIRYIATIRNKTVHEDGFEVEDINSFSELSEHIINQLEEIYNENVQINTSDKLKEENKYNTFKKVFLVAVIALTLYNISQISKQLKEDENNSSKQENNVSVHT
jgi:hypothetical protein